MIMKAPKWFIIENCLEPQEYWDDWVDYRDGLRGANYTDNTKFRYPKWNRAEEIKKRNKKLKKLLKRRKLMHV